MGAVSADPQGDADGAVTSLPMAVPDGPLRSPNGGDSLLPVPDVGRVFRADRRVRLGDVDPTGRLRLDALARYLQDVSGDDTEDSDLPDAQAWVARRTVVEQQRAARLGEPLAMAAFCSGYGSRWAERRVSMVGAEGARIEAVTVWVHVDPTSGRPRRLSPEFHALYGGAAGGRVVTARQVHEPVPLEVPGGRRFPWRPRATDLDILDHVNNAVAWAVVEQLRAEVLSAAGVGRGTDIDLLAGTFRAEVEFGGAVDRATVDRGDALSVVHVASDSGRLATLWSADAGVAHVTAAVAPLAPREHPGAF